MYNYYGLVSGTSGIPHSKYLKPTRKECSTSGFGDLSRLLLDFAIPYVLSGLTKTAAHEAEDR